MCRFSCSLAILLCVLSSLAAGAVAFVDLAGLASESKAAYLIRVTEIVDPGWKDDTGQPVLLAISTVDSTLKGDDRREVTIAFKPTVADQAKYAAGSRYVSFIFGPVRPIIMPHQSLGLHVENEQIDTAILRNEPRTRALNDLLSRFPAVPRP